MAGANDKTEVEDDLIPGEGEDQDQVREVPKDVRGAIRAAMDEVAEKTDDNNDSRVSVGAKADDSNNKSAREADEGVGKIQDKEDKNEGGKKKETKEPVSTEKIAKEVKEEPSIEPPPFFRVKGKLVWDKLGVEEKNVLLQREQEISKGFAQVSERMKSVADIERAIAPRLQMIQQSGIPPGQVVDRLFQWMEGIYNPQTKLKTFKDLAQSFGVNINQLVDQGSNNAEAEQIATNDPPEWVDRFAGAIDERIGAIETTFATQQRQALETWIINWAQDKPYYNHVRELMGQMIAGGAVPPKNGVVDLDGAYAAAVKIHPEVSALIQQEAAQKAAKDAADKAAKEAKEKAEKLVRARRAGSALRPGAPAANVVSQSRNNANLNGKGAKFPSVRDSIKQSLDELRE